MSSVVVGDPVRWSVHLFNYKKVDLSPNFAISNDGVCSRLTTFEGYMHWTPGHSVRSGDRVVTIDGRIDNTANAWEYWDSSFGGNTFLYRFNTESQDLALIAGVSTNQVVMHSGRGGMVPGKHVATGNSGSTTSASLRSPYLVGTYKHFGKAAPWVPAKDLKFAPDITSSSLMFDKSVVCKMRDGRIAHIGFGINKQFGKGMYHDEVNKYIWAGTPSNISNDAGSYGAFRIRELTINNRYIGNIDPIETHFNMPGIGSFCNDPDAKLQAMNTPEATYALSNENKRANDFHVTIYSSDGLTVESAIVFSAPLEHWDGSKNIPYANMHVCYYHIDDNNVCIGTSAFGTESSGRKACRIVLNLSTLSISRVLIDDNTDEYWAVAYALDREPLETAIIDTGKSQSILFTTRGVFAFDRTTGMNIDGYDFTCSLYWDSFIGKSYNNKYIQNANAEIESIGNDRYLVWGMCPIRHRFQTKDAYRGWNPGGMPNKQYAFVTLPKEQRGRWINRGNFKAHPLYNNSAVNVFDFSFIRSVANNSVPVISIPDAFYIIPAKSIDQNSSEFYTIDVQIQDSGAYVFGIFKDRDSSNHGSILGLRLYKYKNPTSLDPNLNKVVERVIPHDGFSDLGICLTRISGYLDPGKYCLTISRFNRLFQSEQDLNPGTRYLWDEINLNDPPPEMLTDLNALPILAILEFGRVRT